MTEPRNATYEGITLEVYNMELMGIHGELIEVYNCWHPELGRFRAYAKELAFHVEGFEQVRPIGLVTYEKARAFVQSHHNEVFECADGLIIKSGAVWGLGMSPNGDDDRFEEELQAFPIVNGMVDIAPIKQWLGY